MARYQVTIDGKTVILEGDHPPSETEARSALASHAAQTQPSSIRAIGKVQSDNPAEQVQEPTTFWGGFGHSILQQMGVGDPNSPISHAARPENLSDVASLLVPNEGFGAGMKAAGGVAADAADAITGGVPLRTYARIVGTETPVVNRVLRIQRKVQAARTAAAANQGGTVAAGTEPTLEEALTNAIADIRNAPAPQPAKITTPPPAELPAGYTPRTTAPRLVRTVPNAAATEAAVKPSRLYFLKPEAEMNPTADITPTPAQEGQQLPAAWQRMTNPVTFPPKEIEGSGLAAAYSEELAKRGIPAHQAIPLVMQNPALAPSIKDQIVAALEKVARYTPQ